MAATVHFRMLLTLLFASGKATTQWQLLYGMNAEFFGSYRRAKQDYSLECKANFENGNGTTFSRARGR